MPPPNTYLIVKVVLDSAEVSQWVQLWRPAVRITNQSHFLPSRCSSIGIPVEVEQFRQASVHTARTLLLRAPDKGGSRVERQRKNIEIRPEGGAFFLVRLVILIRILRRRFRDNAKVLIRVSHNDPCVPVIENPWARGGDQLIESIGDLEVTTE